MPARPRAPVQLLTDRLELLRPEEQLSWGGTAQTWQSAGVVPALVLPAGRSWQSELAVYGEQFRGFRRLRAWADCRAGATPVVAGWRVVVDGKPYVVVDVQDAPGGLTELWLAEAR
jgi:hypothetical protein